MTERQILALGKGKMRQREPSKGIGNAFKLSAFQVGCDRSANFALRRGGNDRVANFATRRGSAATARAIASWLVSLRINEKPRWQVASRVRRFGSGVSKSIQKPFRLSSLFPTLKLYLVIAKQFAQKLQKRNFCPPYPFPIHHSPRKSQE